MKSFCLKSLVSAVFFGVVLFKKNLSGITVAYCYAQ
jgi:hypothetical protein